MDPSSIVPVIDWAHAQAWASVIVDRFDTIFGVVIGLAVGALVVRSLMRVVRG